MNPHYDVPRITRIGTVADLTQAMKTGPKTDATFPAGTPDEDITFS